MKENLFMKKIILISLILSLVSPLYADVESVESLKGVEEVAVVVDALTQEQLRYGLDPLELADWIATELDNNNIKPLSGDKLSEAPLTPAFWLTVKTAIVGEVAAVSLTLSLRQDVQLLRDKEIEVIKAITWSRNSTGMMNPDSLRRGVHIKLNEFIEEFIEDYRKANGKDESSEGDDVMV